MAILKKLLEFQKQNIVLDKDGENPHFRSEYVTLNEVLGKVKKPLNDLGILIVQKPTAEGLFTCLIDTEDDTEVQGFMPWLGADTAQRLLACTTYFRRGTLVALLGLQDEDDDGNAASAVKPPAKAATARVAAPKAAAKNPVARTDEPFVGNPFEDEARTVPPSENEIPDIDLG